MITLLVIFATAVVAGAIFWFYNKRQLQTLAEEIEDKAAVINAFRSFSEGANLEWNGSTTVEATIQSTTDAQTLQNKPAKTKKNYNRGYKKNTSTKKTTEATTQNKPQRKK